MSEQANTPFGPLGITFREPEPNTPDELFELIDDAIEDALYAHQPVSHGDKCSCGTVNNMDGDVLPAHWLGVLSEAVRDVLMRNLREERRTLADGMGGMTIDTKTGITVTHHRPCTTQCRWSTSWLNV